MIMKNALLLFFCYAVEALIMWHYSTSLFIPKRSNKIRVSALVICYFIAFLFSIYDQIFINFISFLLINFIFLYTQYELKCTLSLFHSAIITAIMAMSELALYGIISLFSPRFLSNPTLFHNKILYAILSKILYFLIAYILSHVFKTQKKSTTHRNQSTLLLGAIPLFSLFVMLAFIYWGESTTIPSVNSWMMSLSGFSLLFMNLLAFGVNHYSQQKNIAFTEMQVLLQKEYDSAEYYKMLLEQNENQNILIHDIKKHLQTIDLLNEKKDYDKIKAYIHQLLKSSDLKEFSRLCDHEMLNAILSRYKRQCSNQKIDFIADIRNGTTDFISDSDLTALFCNLLDNAVEAAAGIPGGYIEINIVRKKPTDYVVLSVINSCRNNPFTAGSHSLVTNKSNKKKHGFGMKSIQKAVAKYHGDIQMYYNEDALAFHTIITLIPPEQVS